MGWWKVQGTNDVVGDEVFSVLRAATKQIAASYEAEVGRAPSRSEWQRLVRDALEPIESGASADVRSLFSENGRPESVEIVLRAQP